MANVSLVPVVEDHADCLRHDLHGYRRMRLVPWTE